MATGRAWGLKELFGWFWKSRDKFMAKANFTFWYEQVAKSGLGHMVKVAKMLKRHPPIQLKKTKISLLCARGRFGKIYARLEDR